MPPKLESPCSSYVTSLVATQATLSFRSIWNQNAHLHNAEKETKFTYAPTTPKKKVILRDESTRLISPPTVHDVKQVCPINCSLLPIPIRQQREGNETNYSLHIEVNRALEHVGAARLKSNKNRIPIEIKYLDSPMWISTTGPDNLKIKCILLSFLCSMEMEANAWSSCAVVA